MPRRLAHLLPLALVSVGAALAVARVPQDAETAVVTRRHHGADPLLSAVLLRFGSSSLLESPGRYFSPPILFPDRNPLRGTEPLVAEDIAGVIVDAIQKPRHVDLDLIIVKPVAQAAPYRVAKGELRVREGGD